MSIIFGTDYNGEQQKDELVALLGQYGNVDDVRKDSELTDYVSISDAVAQAVRVSKGVGVLMCGTGGGCSLVANKHKGTYAIRCLGADDAKDAKIINNANVLCLAAKTPLETNKDIITAFFTTKYEGRKPERLKAIQDLEKQTFA